MTKPHLSLSQVRRLLECSAREVATQAGAFAAPEPSEAMLVGSYLDAILTTVSGAEWLDSHPEVIAKSGASKGSPKAAFADVPLMARRFFDSPACQLVEGAESQVKVEADFAGGPVVGVLDWLDLDNARIFDLKTRADFSDGWHTVGGRNVKMPWWYDYTEQFCLYQSLVNQKHDQHCDCYVIAMAKTKGWPIRVARYEQETLDSVYVPLRDRFIRAQVAKDRPTHCRACEYCAEHAPFIVETAAMWVAE
jgi:hypothetical protein